MNLTKFIKSHEALDEVLHILDELMDVVKALHPRMYDRVIERINDL